MAAIVIGEDRHCGEDVLACLFVCMRACVACDLAVVTVGKT